MGLFKNLTNGFPIGMDSRYAQDIINSLDRLQEEGYAGKYLKEFKENTIKQYRGRNLVGTGGNALSNRQIIINEVVL